MIFLKTKEQLSKELGVSRKTLYNYMDQLHIKDLNEENLKVIENYVKSKNKSKEISKSELLEQLQDLKLKNAELSKQNESLLEGQNALLQQVEYYRNSIDSEIRQIKQNITLLLNPPENSKTSFFRRFFKLK